MGELGYATSHDCPDAKRHTKCPDGYLAWHEWAEKKAKRYHLRRCPTCGLWVIWERREVSDG